MVGENCEAYAGMNEGRCKECGRIYGYLEIEDDPSICEECKKMYRQHSSKN